jgi:hypothetical protein
VPSFRNTTPCSEAFSVPGEGSFRRDDKVSVG